MTFLLDDDGAPVGWPPVRHEYRQGYGWVERSDTRPHEVVLTVRLRLDPVPGAFHEPESARMHVQSILTQAIGHYGPDVRVAEVIPCDTQQAS